MRNLWLATLAITAVGLTSAKATDAQYCGAFQNAMEPGRLYAALCREPHCLQALEKGAAGGNFLTRGGDYEFLYLIGNTTIEKSTVIVSAKYTDRVRPDRLRVGLVRDRIAFACQLSPSIVRWSLFKEVETDRFPQDPDESGRRQDVDYANYDQYHRFGFASRPDQDALDQFHVLYSNGKSCVFTADGQRGRYFLLADRDRIPGWPGRIAARLGAEIDIASAGDSERIRSFSRIEVTLGNYAKERQRRACYSFSISTDHDAAEIELVDLEFHVQSDGPGSEGPPTWRVEFRD